MIIKCKPYGYSSEMVYIMVDKISDWHGVNYNGRSGTCVYTTDDKKILVAEYPEDVAKMCEEASKCNSYFSKD